MTMLLRDQSDWIKSVPDLISFIFQCKIFRGHDFAKRFFDNFYLYHSADSGKKQDCRKKRNADGDACQKKKGQTDCFVEACERQTAGVAQTGFPGVIESGSICLEVDSPAYDSKHQQQKKCHEYDSDSAHLPKRNQIEVHCKKCQG